MISGSQREPSISRSAGGQHDGCGRSADIHPDAFLAELLAGAAPFDTETIRLEDAPGRILAVDVRSPSALPGFDQSAMDGFGLHAADLAGAGSTLRISSAALPANAVRLFTGSPVPPGIAGILRREDGDVSDGVVIARRAVNAGADIRRRGEDVIIGALLAGAGSELDPRLIALFAAAGVESVEARPKVRVAVVSTGDELLGRRGVPAVRDANGPMLRCLLAGPAVEMLDGGIHPDDATELAAGLSDIAKTADLIVTTGGSAGSEVDVLATAIWHAGGSATAHRLALRPGRPIVTGFLRGARLLGLPGNPFAAFVGAQLFAAPLIASLAGRPFRARNGHAAVLADGLRPPAARTEFLPASIVGRTSDGRPLVVAGTAGSARLAPLAAAAGLLELRPNASTDRDSPVWFYPRGILAQ